MSVRRLLAVGIAGLLAAGAPAVIPATGWASGGQMLIFTADTNHDTSNGIRTSAIDGTGGVTVRETANAHYDEIDAAPVGEAIAYTRYVDNVVTLFLDNRQLSAPRALYAARLSGGEFSIPYYPSFSPDGQTVLFTVLVYDKNNNVVETHLETVPVAGGRSTRIAGSSGLFDAAFHPFDATRISASRWADDGAAMTGQLIGSALTVTAIPGTKDTDFTRFAPDGQRLVFVTAGKTVAMVAPDGTPLGAITGGLSNYPVFVDDDSVLFTMTPDGASTADIYRFDLGAPSATQVTNTPDINEYALATPRDANPAPPAPSNVRITLAGASPVISWTRPIDGDINQIVVRRAVGPTPPATIGDGDAVPGVGANSVTDHVTPGVTYSYSVFAVDTALQSSGAGFRTMQAFAAPTVNAPGAPWAVGTSAHPTVSWLSAGGDGVHYRVWWAASSSPRTWHPWLADTLATSAHFGAGNKPTVVRGGVTYSVRVVAMDAYGNASAAGTDILPIPVNDSAANYGRGWIRTRNAGFWNGDAHMSTKAGARAVLSFTGSRVQVIATRCPTCGSFTVLIDGHGRGTHSTQGPRLALRQVVYTWTTSRVGRHVITIVNAGTRSHSIVRLDAFAIRS